MTSVVNEQREIWDAVSEGWRRWQNVFERGAASVSTALVRLGGLRPGQSVLDVGTGLGEPALTAAGVVGPRGRVLGIDVSPAMISAARARAAHLPFAEFVVGEVTTAALAPGAFDAVLSRWGLMFAADRAATLRALAGLLRPGGVLAAATWAPPPAVPMISLAFRVIAERLALAPPPPGLPGPFSMADPKAVAAELAEAGFTEVTVTERKVPFVMDSVSHFVAFSRDVLPPRMRSLVREAADPLIWEAVAEAAAVHARPDGSLDLTSTCLCVRGVR
ncbi:class I SAM-dependent methyltransferase [Nonomuraea sp. NPDC003754]